MAEQAITGNSYTNQNIRDVQRRLDEATKQLQTFNTTRTSDEDLRKRAESEYMPTHNAQVAEQNNAKQSAQTARDNQLAALQQQYERDKADIGKSYDAQRVTANNTMLARGMNNSSLALAMLNRVEDQRNRALSDLAADRTLAENAANSSYNDAVKAADAAIGRLGVDLQTNIDARFQALKDAENSRVFQETQAANDVTQYINELAMQVEQLRQQGYSQYLQEQADAEAKRQFDEQMALQREQWEWEKAQNEKTGGGSPGSSSGGTGNGGTPPTGTSPSPQNPGSLEDMYNNQEDDDKGGILSEIFQKTKGTVKGGITGLSSSIAAMLNSQKNSAAGSAQKKTKGKSFQQAAKK